MNETLEAVEQARSWKPRKSTTRRESSLIKDILGAIIGVAVLWVLAVGVLSL